MDGCWPETTFLKAEHPSKYLHSTLTAHFFHLKLCQVGGGKSVGHNIYKDIPGSWDVSGED